MKVKKTRKSVQVKEQAVLRLLRGDDLELVGRRLGLHRQTVSRYVRLGRAATKSTISPPGSSEGEGPKTTLSPAGSSGRRSQCERYASIIETKLSQGHSGQRIFQDLQREQGFDGSYDSVKRFLRRVVPMRNNIYNPFVSKSIKVSLSPEQYHSLQFSGSL